MNCDHLGAGPQLPTHQGRESEGVPTCGDQLPRKHAQNLTKESFVTTSNKPAQSPHLLRHPSNPGFLHVNLDLAVVSFYYCTSRRDSGVTRSICSGASTCRDCNRKWNICTETLRSRFIFQHFFPRDLYDNPGGMPPTLNRITAQDIPPQSSYCRLWRIVLCRLRDC